MARCTYSIAKLVSRSGRPDVWSSEGLGEADGYKSCEAAASAVRSMQVLAHRDPAWAGTYAVRDSNGRFAAVIVLTTSKRANPARSANWKGDDDEPREDEESEDEFDLQTEMQNGMIIGEARGGRYSVSLDQRFLSDFPTFGAALKFAAQKMEDSKYWPNVFYVNERGNTDLLVLKPKIVHGKVIKVTSKIVRGWV